MRKVSSSFQVVGTLRDTANVLDRARPNPAQSRQHVWNQRRQILDSVRRSAYDNDAERERGYILLVFQVGIHRDEHVDRATGSLQQHPVLGSGPAKAMNGGYGVAGEGVDQVVRKVFVKQYAHESAGFRARAQERRSLVRVGRTETA